MSASIRLGAAVAALFAACTLDVGSKTHCNFDNDCLSGDVCISGHCGLKIGPGGTGGGGSAGTFDGGPPPPRMCPTSPVNACPAADAGQCEKIYCGGPLWLNGPRTAVSVPYRILDPDALFSDGYKRAIRASAAAWSSGTSRLVTFQECTNCSGHFISVVPDDRHRDGIANPEDILMEQFLPMPVDSSGRVSPHRIAHQWGHVLGLSHTYQRADRDRYMGFDPEVWCPPAQSGLPPHCAAGLADLPGLPAVSTGSFGVFDEKSKMNGLRSEGICGADEPDEDSGEPTLGDVSAMAELFTEAAHQWSPFQPVVPAERSVPPTQPLDHQLAPGVDPIGSPQIAEIDYGSIEIFVRGTDDHVYRTARSGLLTSSTAQWTEWEDVAGEVNADPAVVFAWLANPETLFLAYRAQDGQIHLRARRGGTWGGSTPLGAPPGGAGSAPALASKSPSDLAVLVRGADGLIYLLACSDATTDCAASATRPDAWRALPPPSSSATAVFVGKPSAIWPLDNSGLTVAAISDERVPLLITGVDAGGSSWVPVDTIRDDIGPDDPGVAIAFRTTPGDVSFFTRNQRGLLVTATLGASFPPIGGVLASPPAAVAVRHGDIRTDVAAIIDDHGHPGVWWRYFDSAYKVPCDFNQQPPMCLQCL